MNGFDVFAAPRPTCDSCGSHDVATIDGITGRRCADHPPTFDPTTAVELMRRGLPGVAMAYLRTLPPLVHAIT